MDDPQIHGTIEQLVAEEHALWQRESAGNATEADRQRLQDVKVSLDQCWDLLRQRRALREAVAIPAPPTSDGPRSWSATSSSGDPNGRPSPFSGEAPDCRAFAEPLTEWNRGLLLIMDGVAGSDTPGSCRTSNRRRRDPPGNVTRGRRSSRFRRAASDARRPAPCGSASFIGNRGQELTVAKRLSKGVAGRLFRYRAVLAQAQKTGRARITSQELAAYAGANASQVRRDLAALGRFGTRGVGYPVEGLLRELGALLGEREQRVALVGAGRLGQAIASSSIFAEQGVTIAAIFDSDPAKLGTRLGALTVRDFAQLRELVRDEEIVAGVLAVPAASAQQVANDLVSAGVKVIFNYTETLLERAGDVFVLSSNPATALLATLSLGLD